MLTLNVLAWPATPQCSWGLVPVVFCVLDFVGMMLARLSAMSGPQLHRVQRGREHVYSAVESAARVASACFFLRPMEPSIEL